MPLMVARPYKHPKTGIYWLRKGVPEHLRALVGKREEKFSLDTRDPDEARRRHAKAVADIAERWANLRIGERVLTEREAHELAEPLSRKWLELYEDDPGNQTTWHPDLFDRFTLFEEASPSESDDVEPNVTDGGEAVRGVPLDSILLEGMRTFAHLQAKSILDARGLSVDTYSHLKLVRACAVALQRASLKLATSYDTGEPVELDAVVADGHTPTAAAARSRTIALVPPVGGPTQVRQATEKRSALTLTGLLAAWWSEAKAAGRKPSTFENYRNAVSLFIDYLEHDDPTRVSDVDVVGFKDHRLATPSRRTGKLPSAKTVKDNDLSALKTLFGWAVANRKLASNPASGITIKLGRPVRNRPKGFTEAEAKTILAAASDRKPSGDAPQLQAAKRWVPWLCAFTGARVGELAQLRKEDVAQRDGHWLVRITPEAGTVKTNQAREVVLHSQLVEMGFPEFVMAASSGHLFLKPRQDGDVLKPLQTLKNRLAEFGRSMVPDEGVAPNHGWRHRFTTIGLEAGIPPRVLNAIQGHAPQTVADSYGDVTLKTMAAAIAKLPRLEV